jgi:hypothetical protein
MDSSSKGELLKDLLEHVNKDNTRGQDKWPKDLQSILVPKSELDGAFWGKQFNIDILYADEKQEKTTSLPLESRSAKQ